MVAGKMINGFHNEEAKKMTNIQKIRRQCIRGRGNREVRVEGRDIVQESLRMWGWSNREETWVILSFAAWAMG